MKLQTSESYMLASNVPLLQGKTLAPFLQTMDIQEQQAIDRDMANQKTKMQAYLKEYAGIKQGSLAAFLGGFIIFFGLAATDASRNPIGEAITFSSFSVGFLAGISYVHLVLPAEWEFESQLSDETHRNRGLRLQQKVRDIAAEILKTSEPDEVEQLNAAKDFFEQNSRLVHSYIENKLKVTVKHC